MSENVNLLLTYYPWITQSLGAGPLAAAMNEFASALSAELSDQMRNTSVITVAPPMSVPDQIKDISTALTGNVAGKIAMMNPIGYALAHEQTSTVESLAVVLRKIGDATPGPTYRSQIYTNVLTDIHSLDGFRKRSFGFGSPQSTSNFLVPAHLLWSNGLHPVNAFSRLEFVGGHQLVAKAVYEGRIDGGAGHDGVISDLANVAGYGDAAERLIRIAWSDEIPSDPIAVNTPDSELKGQIMSALLAVAKPGEPNSTGNVIIEKFWGTAEGLTAVDPNFYKSLLPYMRDIAVRPADVLQP